MRLVDATDPEPRRQQSIPLTRRASRDSAAANRNHNIHGFEGNTCRVPSSNNIDYIDTMARTAVNRFICRHLEHRFQSATADDDSAGEQPHRRIAAASRTRPGPACGALFEWLPRYSTPPIAPLLGVRMASVVAR
jgi:hypothetical protein